jgi:hypothetical protein
MPEPPKSYMTAEEIEEVVRKFETYAFDPSEFNHPEHLIVALLYLKGASVEEALERMRRSLFRFLAHHQIQENVYHETITLFWLKLVRGFLSQADDARTLVEIANDLIQTHGDSHLIYSYFSKERLDSEEARQRWIEPDLKPLNNPSARKLTDK